MWGVSLARCIGSSLGVGVGLYAITPITKWQWWTHLVIIAGTFVLYGYIEYRTYLRPARRMAKVFPSIMSTLSQDLRNKATSTGCPVRLNVMQVYRPARWLWFFRFFRIVWSEGMQNDPDVGMELPVKRGVVGECLRTKHTTVADERKLKELLPTIPKKYRSGVEGLTAVICFPIFEPPLKGNTQSGRVIGVLCLDSKGKSAFESLTNPDFLKDVLENRMNELATVAGWLL